MPGLLKLLSLLKDKNLKIAIASNSSHNGISFNIEKIGISNYFDEIISGEYVGKWKPEPDIYLETAKRLGLYPSECLVLEDSQSGVESGERAEMKVIAVPSKYTKHQDFSKADLVVKSLEDLSWERISELFND